MSKATIYTIAQTAGVSTTTVSKILNNKGGISRETTTRVMEVIRKHNFVPQQIKKHGNAIGVVMFFSEGRPFSSPYLARLINGICGEAFATGRDMTLIDGDRLQHCTPEELHCFFAANSLAGLLGVNLGGNSPFYERLRQTRFPFIQLSNEDAIGNYVSTRNYEAVTDMIDYLVGMGHQDIAFLGMFTERFESLRRREAAYRDVLARHGIEARAEFILDLPDDDRLTIKNALSRLLARPQPPTALFFASEALAATPSVLAQLNVAVPDDLSVAGMANKTPEPQEGPDLACIIQPAEAMGREGVRGLLALVEGEAKVALQLDNHIHYGDTIRRR